MKVQQRKKMMILEVNCESDVMELTEKNSWPDYGHVDIAAIQRDSKYAAEGT